MENQIKKSRGRPRAFNDEERKAHKTNYMLNKEWYCYVCYSSKKRKHSFSILKAFFVRHSSEYETSDNDRKVKRNI